MVETQDWQPLSQLHSYGKRLVHTYFPGKSGYFILSNNVLHLSLDNWGNETIYLHEVDKRFDMRNYYYIEKEIGSDLEGNPESDLVDTCITVQIGNWNTFLKMEEYIYIFHNEETYSFVFTIVEEECSKKNIEYLSERYRNMTVLKALNKGMDIGLFLVTLHYLKEKEKKYSYLLKLHTKTDDNVRNNVLDNLIVNKAHLFNAKMSKEKAKNCISLLRNPNIGMVGGFMIPNYYRNKELFIDNMYHIEKLCNLLFYENIDPSCLEFVAGTMFWFKMEAFQQLDNEAIAYIYQHLNDLTTLDLSWYAAHYKLKIENEDSVMQHYKFHKEKNAKVYLNNLHFQKETGEHGIRDFMVEHAFERFFGYLCKKNNYLIVHS